MDSLISILTLVLAVFGAIKLWLLYKMQNNLTPDIKRVVEFYMSHENMIELFKFHKLGSKKYFITNLITLFIFIILIFMFVNMIIQSI
jgi:hypothetical protein